MRILPYKRLIPRKALRCQYCRRFYRTWTGLGWHQVFRHTIKAGANSVICVIVMIVCVATVIIAELVF
jgi:hypothetical protein